MCVDYLVATEHRETFSLDCNSHCVLQATENVALCHYLDVIEQGKVSGIHYGNKTHCPESVTHFTCF